MLFYLPILLPKRQKSRFGDSSFLTGFTLIETMVVATIFSFIALGIAASFISGMKIWARAQNIDFSKYNNILTLEIISKELRQGIKDPAIGFEIKVDEFSFPSLIGNSIVKITYKFDSEKKILLRRQVDLESIIKDLEADKEQEKVVLSSLEEFFLSYFYPYFDKEKGCLVYIWKEVKDTKDEWAEAQGIFTAIRLKGKTKGEEFSKTIFIPIS